MTKATQNPLKDGERLISAIQSLSTIELKRALKTIKGRHCDKDGSKNLIYQSVNAGFGNTGLTALIVASKAYSVHFEDARLRHIFEQMIDLLLANGADPYVQADNRLDPHGQCLNAITACNGRIPVGIKSYISKPRPHPREEEVRAPKAGMKATYAAGGYGEHYMESFYRNEQNRHAHRSGNNYAW